MNNAIGCGPRARPWTWLPEFANQQLPRYTSYPPANRFTPTVGPGEARRAIESLPSGSTLSLYLHIPFCQQLCWYCGCHTSVPTTANPVAGYLETLEAEIRQTAAWLPSDVSVSHVHFGGGSPDIAGPAGVRRLAAALRDNFKFAPGAEIAAELDPRGVTPMLAEALGEVGFSRVSLGLQTLAPGVQRRINRVQPPAVVEEAITLLRRAGVAGLNLDLMYGLPGQVSHDVVETAHFAASMDADRIALFGYAHVPWFKKHQGGIRESELPVGEARFRQAEAGAHTLISAGYQVIGFDHFAAPTDSLAIAEAAGALRRNFQGYTDDTADALLGFGSSSISSFPGLVWQNTTDNSAYAASVAAGQPAAVRGTRPTLQDVRIGEVIERLLCSLESEIPADLRIAACPALAPLEEARLVEWSRSRLLITEKGRPYARNVAAAFDPGMQSAAARHSLAV